MTRCQQEFHGLVAALVPFCRLMLGEHGAFLPVGGVFTSGQAVITGAGMDDPEATVPERLQVITASLREHAADASCAAVAYCVDVRLTDPRDGQATEAVHLVFEHRSGEAVEAFFPYKKVAEGYEHGRPMIRLTACRIFEAARSSYH
jgi:hypothetical protein